MTLESSWKKGCLPHGVDETVPMVCPKPAPGEDEKGTKVGADQDEEEPIIAAEREIRTY